MTTEQLDFLNSACKGIDATNKNFIFIEGATHVLNNPSVFNVFTQQDVIQFLTEYTALVLELKDGPGNVTAATTWFENKQKAVSENTEQYFVGKEILTFDKEDACFIKGKLIEVDDTNITVQWEDLEDPTTYEKNSILLTGNILRENLWK